MSTLEQLPKRGRPRKTESIPEQSEVLVALESVKEVKKRVNKKKVSETEIENGVVTDTTPVDILTKEHKKRLAKEVISERTEKKRKVSKSLERRQEYTPLENEEVFHGENGSTIFTGPKNLPIEYVSTTESVDYQPNIDDMSFGDIIGRNVQKEKEIIQETSQDRTPEYKEVLENTYESPEDLTPEELYAPLLPKDTTRDYIELNQSEHHDKPDQSFNDKSTGVLKRFWDWVSRKNPDMYTANNYYGHDQKEEVAKHNKNKKESWFEELNNSKKHQNIDREAINQFVDSQIEQALNEFKNNLSEGSRLYDARTAEQALEKEKMLQAWESYLEERK